MDEPNQIEIADWRSGNRVHVFYWELPSPVYAQDEEHGRMTMRRSYRDHCESDLCLGYHTVQQKRLIKERTRSHISNVPHTVTPYLILTLKFLIVLAIDSIVVERNIGVVGIVSLLAGVAIKSSSTATTPTPATTSTAAIFATVRTAGREEIGKGLFLSHTLPFVVKIRKGYTEIKWIDLYIRCAMPGEW